MAKPDLPKPYADPCKNVWLHVNDRYHEGTLVACQGSEPSADGKVHGWVGDGLWPPSDVSFIACERGNSVEIVVLKKPDATVHVYLFEWKEGMAFLDRPRELRHVSYPAATRSKWQCDLDPGRYLLTTSVHWPSVRTERSFGLEIK